MLKFVRRLGLIGGLAALARSPMGQRVIGRAKAYVSDPENRRKLLELRDKAIRSPRTTQYPGTTSAVRPPAAG
jgi:hypothetical protein